MGQTGVTPALTHAARDGRLVVFVGAGVSVAPPTCLPSWWEVNQAVVEALARQVEPDVGREAANGFAHIVSERQRADRFPPEYQAEVIVGRLRHRYFEVLRCLDGDEPNASHLALATLARAGCVRAILTTNFDRVLEAAFQTVNTPLDVRYRPEQMRALADDPALLERADAPCQLLKIHGSADAPDTLVDTLSQRKRGLPPATDECIRHLLRFGHWLFVGFSGADLEADPGYLHLRGDADVARGFTWLVREGSQPLRAVRSLETLYADRGHIVHGELPGWLDGLAQTLAGDARPAATVLAPAQVEARRSAATRAVLEHTDAWAVEQGKRRCSVVLAALLEAVGDPAAALELLTRVRERATDEDRATGTYGMVCDQLGSLYRARGENELALERFREAATIFEALDAEEARFGVRSNMALALVDLGRYDEALQHFEAAREAAAARGDRDDEAVALHNIGLVHRSRGDFAAAVRIFETELREVTALGDEQGRATVLLSIGDALARLDRYDEALDRLRESLAIVERLGAERGRANALGNIATVHHIRADYDEAVRVYGQAKAIFERLGDVGSIANTLLNLASIAQARGQLDDALALATDAATRAETAGLTPMHARALHTVGALHRDRGDLDLAAKHLEQALALRNDVGDRHGQADTLNDLGILRHARGDAKGGREALEEALRLRRELGEERSPAETLNNLAMLAQDREDFEEARRLLREALSIYDRLGLHAAAAPAAFNLGNTCLALHDFDRAAHWFDVALGLNEQIGNRGRAADAHLAIAWTRGLQGRVQDALNAFAAAASVAHTPDALLRIAQRMHALAAIYRQHGHDDPALNLEVEARRIAEAGQ